MIEAEKTRPRGQYETDLDSWTCTCPSYLISRFLLCKHIVRAVNEELDDLPLRELKFFQTLKRQWYPPFYAVEGINVDIQEDCDTDDKTYDIFVLQRNITRSSTPATDFDPLELLQDDEDSEEEAQEVVNQTILDVEGSNIPAREGNSDTRTPSDKDDGGGGIFEELEGVRLALDSDWEQDGLGFMDTSEERVVYSSSGRSELQECFNELMVLIEGGSVHPKLAGELETAFQPVRQLGRMVTMYID
ncbi:hypothetical protein VNI00_018233 [Paramarasmius palmivorus]|uniref:SWIM-type domain-containing protein n=1 Tax=Paramarasmius palmivorus TaxID=297713 RepID=A0AAW0B2L5_9AGAR